MEVELRTIRGGRAQRASVLAFREDNDSAESTNLTLVYFTHTTGKWGQIGPPITPFLYHGVNFHLVFLKLPEMLPFWVSSFLSSCTSLYGVKDVT